MWGTRQGRSASSAAATPAGAGLGTLRAGDPLGQLAAPGEAQGVPRGTQGRLVHRPFTASTTGGRLPAPSVATSASVSSNPRFEGKKGHTQSVDRTSADADASAFDALVLPGGVVNADDLRLDEAAVAFTRAFFDAGKPVAVICHGGWILTDADVLRGRTMTSYPSLKTDLTNAGATWVDQEVVVEDGLISSRTPDDLPAFNARRLEELS